MCYRYCLTVSQTINEYRFNALANGVPGIGDDKGLGREAQEGGLGDEQGLHIRRRYLQQSIYGTEAEFLDVIGTTVLRVFLFATYSHLY
jgi:hypothetical protein